MVQQYNEIFFFLFWKMYIIYFDYAFPSSSSSHILLTSLPFPTLWSLSLSLSKNNTSQKTRIKSNQIISKQANTQKNQNNHQLDKNMPKWNKTNSPQKNAWSSFCCGQLFLGMGPALEYSWCMWWFEWKRPHRPIGSGTIRWYGIVEVGVALWKGVCHGGWALKFQKLKAGLVAHCILLLPADLGAELSCLSSTMSACTCCVSWRDDPWTKLLNCKPAPIKCFTVVIVSLHKNKNLTKTIYLVTLHWRKWLFSFAGGCWLQITSQWEVGSQALLSMLWQHPAQTCKILVPWYPPSSLAFTITFTSSSVYIPEPWKER